MVSKNGIAGVPAATRRRRAVLSSHNEAVFALRAQCGRDARDLVARSGGALRA